MFHGYFYIEALSLTTNQKDTLVDALKLWGLKNNSELPHERNHWRIRPDNNAVIFEAVFDDTLLTAVAMRSRLATIFGVSLTSVNYATTQNAYGSLITFTYNSIQRLKLGVFGGLSSTLEESRLLAQDFLIANSLEWEEQI